MTSPIGGWKHAPWRSVFFNFFSVKEEKRGRALVSEGTEEKMKGETEGVAVQSTAAMFNGLNRIVWSVSPSF